MKTLLPIIVLVATLAAASAAQTPPASATPLSEVKAAEGDIEIYADDGFEYNLLTGLAVYTGNVRVTNAQNTLTCELLTVKRTPTTNTASLLATGADPVNQASSGRIESIVAEKKVVITQADSRATGEKAAYDFASDSVTLTGNPRVETKNGWMTASEFVFDRKNNKVRAKPPIHMSGSGAAGIFTLPGAGQTK